MKIKSVIAVPRYMVLKERKLRAKYKLPCAIQKKNSNIKCKEKNYSTENKMSTDHIFDRNV